MIANKKIKIGFYLPSQANALKYGGSTFYDFLIGALDEHLEKNIREVILICNRLEDAKELTTRNLQIVQIPDYKISLEQKKLTLKERVRLFILRHLFPESIYKFLQKSLENSDTNELLFRDTFEKIIDDYQIDLMIYANQFNIPTINRPYMWILWDMACRNINFFYSMETSNKLLNKLRYCSSNAFRIITANQTGAREIAKYLIFPEERIKSIPFPAQEDLKLAKETVPEKKYSNYIFYPALLTSHKNHIVILKALRILHDQNININLVLTGAEKGGLEYTLTTANELNLQKFIHYLGVVPIEELKWIYKNAEALVFPSLLGPNNFPPIEAMSLGVPVLVSDIEGHRNQLQENALFFDPLCPQSLATQISRLFGDPALRKKLIHSGSRFVESLTPEKYVIELLECADEFAPYRSTYR